MRSADAGAGKGRSTRLADADIIRQGKFSLGPMGKLNEVACLVRAVALLAFETVLKMRKSNAV
ncbi:hypothetical protein CUJ84_pRLN3000005 (plasmid) [Rhizobium leguminosarum]|uniref:Uncharacterized protein n=1 Tax=Rhizobium leguminosarum TaxID=384 RepID=A0A2K9ZFX4_RHILE|nr:hypothetical protein CUJ84_pRLN3000005 [Rhizobium leguminosarum]